MEPVYGATSASTLAGIGINNGCYFIDFVGGADTNAGTSEGAAWKHAPGMAGCANNCSSASISTGTGFIFKGGVTWDSTTALWTWSHSGASGHPIYLGYDPAWFTGASWTRPIISCSGTCSAQMALSATFVDIDNLEWTGIFNNQSAATIANVYAINRAGTGNSDDHLYENYFHGSNSAHDGSHTPQYIGWPSSGDDNTSTLHHNVLDNSDTCTPPGPCTFTAIQYGPRQIFMNYIGYFGGSSVVLNNPIDFHNNVIEWQVLSPDNGTDHENMFESNGESGSAMVLYGNVVQHGRNVGVVDFQMGPNSLTSYAFNNVLPDMDGGNMMQMYEGNNGSSNVTFWVNNTAEGGVDSGTPGGNCGRSSGSLNTANWINTHCITTTTGNSWIAPTAGTNNFKTNLPQSKAAANSQGYSLTGATYSFIPTLGTGSTVGAGTNEASLCTTIGSGATSNATVNANAQAACMQDTSYGVTYNVSNHTITGVGRAATNPRPSSGAWDIGAYEFGGAPAVCTPVN
jgi:hypothetical protein